MKKLSFLFLLLLSILFLVPSSSGSPTYENFLDYTKVEPDSIFTITSTRVTCVGLDRNMDAYVWDDKGSGHFSDFEHYIDVKQETTSSHGSRCGAWILTNDTPNDYLALTNGLQLRLASSNDMMKFNIVEVGGNESGFSASKTEGVLYYVRLKRAGTSFRCDVYSIPALRLAGGNGDVWTATITVTTTTYRYIEVTASMNDGTGGCYWDGYVEKLNLKPCYITFYNNTGGIFRVDNATIINGTQKTYPVGSVIELASLPQNSSYVFLKFSWDNGNSTTNPCNYTVTSNMTIWCYFGSAGRSAAWVLAAGAILVLVCVPAVVLFWRKR